VGVPLGARPSPAAGRRPPRANLAP
jgi:hypothetical protein